MPVSNLIPRTEGLAGDVITAKIEEIADRMMRENVILEPVKPESVEKIDLAEFYIRYI